MQFYMITGFSTASEEEAMASALGGAMQLAAEAESIHVLVLAVAKVGDGWQVMVKVVVEPRLSPEATSKKSGEPEARPKKKYDREDEDQAALIHFYVLTQNAPLLESFLADQAFSPYVHVMTEGPLWDEAVNFYPDVDFYEAAHPAGLKTYEINHPEAKFEMNRFVGRLKQYRATNSLELDG